MPGHRVANSCCTPGRGPAILMMATRWAPSSKPLRGSPAARSSAPMSGRCYLKGRAGDAANVILSAVGYNLRLVLAWLRTILRVVLLALFQTFAIRLALKPAF